MPDGDSSTAGTVKLPMETSGDLFDHGQSPNLTLVNNRDGKVKKDPTKIAREYQLELCKIAMKENVIVYLGTGCGKTHIAVLHIMKVLYKNNSTKVPRIFGMTASPVVGKGGSSAANLPKSINSLEQMLNAKVYSVDDTALESFVTTPAVQIYHYSSTANMETSLYWKIEEIKCQCIETLGRSIEDHQKRMSTKKLLNRVHDNVVFCLKSLGIWGALQASRILLSGDLSERQALVEAEGISSDESVCDKYLAKTAELLTSKCMTGHNVSDPSSLEILKEPLFSAKLLRLIGILTSFRLQQNRKCIIFVNRIVTARSLSYILQKLKLLSQWKNDFLVGVHAGVKSMSRKTMNTIVEKFRSGELNLLVATKVGEEGLDIQTCCLVIRFDLPETVASFIQSRGRARMPRSEYAFLVDSGNEKELAIIDGFEKDELRMNTEIAVRTSSETHNIPVEKIFRVDSSGASVSAGYSISLLHQYCSKLPHDEYFDPKPSFFYFDDSGGTVCQITLPSNAPIHQIVSAPYLSMEASKRDACLKAIEELYKLGSLNDCLLPKQNDAEPEVLDSSDSDDCEDNISRGELYEMLVPSAFRQSWKNTEKTVRLNSYYIKFCPSKHSNIVNNSNLFKLAIRRNLQVYIFDQAFDPFQFYALGRPCPRVCTEETEDSIHLCLNSGEEKRSVSGIRCNKNHHWLHRKTIADAVEALVGAFIVDSGFKAAFAFLTWIGIQVNFEASQVVNICTGSVDYFPLSAEVDIPSLESKLGHHFVHKGLLLQAFVHPSYNKHGGGCYQRLEFLGDAVLDYLITSYLYSAYPKLKPGQLTDLRALSVNNKAFACVAVDRCFDEFLLCDSNALTQAIKKYADCIRRPISDCGNNGGPKSPKALGDLVESCIGAVLLDSGFDLNKVWKIMTSFLDPIMKFSSSLQLSPVRDLQELCQFNNLELQLLPSKFAKTFSVEAKVIGDGVCEKVYATSQNKKEASRIASQLLFSKLKAQGFKLKSKTLEDVMKSTSKTEPELIGYDETPIDVTDTTTIGQVMVNGDLCNEVNPKIRPIQEVSDASSSNVKPVVQRLQSSLKGKASETIRNRDCVSDSSKTAKARLYELCASYCWKAPSFECCKEEGPDHLKLFTCKATMKIEEAPDTVFEFIGEPLPKKKDATDSAAEGALWYLQKEGYLHNANGN